LLALCIVCVCVFATLLAVGNTHISEASATSMFQSIQSKAEYPLQQYQTAMLTTTFTDFLGSMILFYREPLMQRYLSLSWIVTLPTTAYLVHRTWLMMTRNGYSIFLRAAAIGASVAPLAVHVIGVDPNRWVALAILTSFLVYATVRLQGGVADASVSTSQSNLLLPAALIAMNLSSSIPLFDGYVVRSFPYEELLDDLGNVLARKEPFPPLPEQCSVTGDCYFIHGEIKPPQSGISRTDFCINKTPPPAHAQATAPN
jgi:hypothetical protein